jgi:hypothetical protein
MAETNANAGGRLRQTMIDAITHRDAIVAASVTPPAHPTGHDFTAAKLSTRPLR